MRNRCIRWSLTSRRAWQIMLSAALSGPLSAAQLDASPDIEADLSVVEEQTRAYRSQRLESTLVTPAAPGYRTLLASPDPLPEVGLVAPASDELPVVTIEAAAPAEIQPQIEWTLLQDNPLEADPESKLFRQLALESGPGCVPGFDCPVTKMELPPWPDQVRSEPAAAPLQIFDDRLISPFDPIPELGELPFPKLQP